MKLIIDITELMWERLKKHSLNWGDIEDIKDSIREGTPLDDLRAEIQENIETFSMSDWETNNILADGLQMALNIIDGYRGGEQT